MFDPRIMASEVYRRLAQLRTQTQDGSRLKDQKGQAVELYTYISTWGLMRLKAEETALSQEGRKEIVTKFFECLQTISGQNNLTGDQGLLTLTNLQVDDYLGLTGLALELAQEFSFWGNAIYVGVERPD
jgi:hypothetical protein